MASKMTPADTQEKKESLDFHLCTVCVFPWACTTLQNRNVIMCSFFITKKIAAAQCKLGVEVVAAVVLCHVNMSSQTKVTPGLKSSWPLLL